MKKVLKRLCSLVVTAAVTASALPLAVFAEPEQVINLPEAELDAEIYENDVFYLGTLSAGLPENGNGVYRLKIGRGGDAETESTALLKVADITARYGKDYYIRIGDTHKKVDGPEDSSNLLDLMEGDYTQSELADADQIAEAAENDEEFQQAYDEAIANALDLIADQSGLTEEHGEEYAEMPEGETEDEDTSVTEETAAEDAANDAEVTDETQAEENTETDDPDAIPAVDGDKVIIAGDGDGIDEVQQARTMFLDADAVAQRVEATGGDQAQTFQDLQKVANFMTDGIVGAEVELTFAPGETEKYIEIVPKDNLSADGDRLFYAMLGAPTGTTTNSAASSCAFTILDDEEQEPSVVSFSEETYVHTPGEDHVTVTVQRTGAVNSVVSAVLKTTGEGSAMVGRDYSEVERQIVFPFGIDSITVDIPVRTEYFNGDADFGLELLNDTGSALAQATVSLTGTYTESMTRQYNAPALLGNDPGSSTGNAAEPPSLADVRTYGSLDVSDPGFYENEDNMFGGHNQYNSSKKWWEMDWKDNSILYNRKGTVMAAWYLEWQQFPIWLGGARVKWSSTNTTADFGMLLFNTHGGFNWRAELCDPYRMGNHLNNWDDSFPYTIKNGLFKQLVSYNGRQKTSGKTMDLYPGDPSLVDEIKKKGNYDSLRMIGDLEAYQWAADQIIAPREIYFYNHGRKDNAAWLRIHSIQPILRPFNVTLQEPDKLTFLQADGTRAEDKLLTTAFISGANGNGDLPRWLGETFTVSQANVSALTTQYTLFSGMDLIAGDKTYNLASNKNAAAHDLMWEFSEENLNAMFNKVGRDDFLSTLKENTAVKDKNGCPTYCDFQVKPEFSYIDSKVTLRNPYDFPVTFTISGTDYELDAKGEKELNYHFGDRLYTMVSLPGDAKLSYDAVGFDIKYIDRNEEHKTITKKFTDNKPEYINLNADQHRLDYAELTIEPKLQVKGNQIVVKVKTDELDSFKDSGIFAHKVDADGNASDEYVLSSSTDETYTYFTFADTSKTFNGSKYVLSAEAKDSDYVCLWYDRTMLRWYEGTSFYYVAGFDPERNTIELTLEKTNRTGSMSGTLYYANYNKMNEQKGSMSMRPASFAIISSGLAGATADEDGSFVCGVYDAAGNKLSDSFGYFYDSTPRYVRYAVTVNGSDMIRETLLPADGGNIDITSAFGEGLSPATSLIFNNLKFTPKYPENSAFKVLNDYQFPIVNGEWVDMTASIKPTTYTASTISSGGTPDETKTESPKSVQYIVYDKDGRLKYSYPVCDTMTVGDDGAFEFNMNLDFAMEHSAPETNEDTDNTEVVEKNSSYTVEPGDQLYIRLTTNREGLNFTYSDLYTGYTFVESTVRVPEVEQGIESPLNVEFEELPFIGSSGFNFSFANVSVGFAATDKGYRISIGTNVADIYDKVNKTRYSSIKSDDYADYGNEYSYKKMLTDPKGFIEGVGNTFDHVFLNQGIQNRKGMKDEIKNKAESAIGSPQFALDVMLGIYFDFWPAKVVDPNAPADAKTNATNYTFAGVGGYLAVSGDFKVSYYFLIPVISIPAYINLKMNANIMGTFGAQKDPNAYEITYDEAKGAQVDFNSALSEFYGEVKGGASVQVNGGIGLCGVVGLRAYGNVDVAGLWNQPVQLGLKSSWGAKIKVSVGMIVDLFVYSHNFNFKTWDDWCWGSVKEARDLEKQQSVQAKPLANGGFVLSDSGSQASEWHGDTPLPQYALTPAQSRVLASNAYDHPDSQLITMRDGTVVLVFVDSDPEKSPYQRTTLKMSVCKGSTWSEPVEICNDGTADFQPSVAEMKDGRLLVSWVSTSADNITDETPITDYFSNMNVYASFVTINDDGSVTSDKPTNLTSGAREKFYDSMPTVVCDMVTGDAIVYYIKSGRTTGDVFDIANPYTNDSVICYMLYNAEADTDTKNGNEVTIPQGWLFNDFYNSEYHGDSANEEFLITNYGGQRFLDSPTFEGENGAEFYAIPDFTAIAYNGFAVYAYTIDKDSSNDTYNDKEIMLQVYNFQTHETKYRTQITDDYIADAMPHLFRSQSAEISNSEESTHTKLFWYRDNKNICYIDVTKLIQEGIDDNGVLITSDGTDREYTYTDENGNTVYTYLEPILVSTPITDTHTANQSADFSVAEDANGSLFVLWTEGVTDENGNASSEIFATSLYSSGNTDEEDNHGGISWSKPYQITKDGYFHDEMAVTMSGEDLITVYNQYAQAYNPVNDGQEYNGEVDQSVLTVSEMNLVATKLEPCGSVAPESISVSYGTNTDGSVELVLPEAGKPVDIAVNVSNNGLTTANGYKLTLYAVNGGSETMVGQIESTDAITPNSGAVEYFEYTLPDNIDGMYFRAETQELKQDGVYYSENYVYTSEPMIQHANFLLSDVKTYQENDGFHMSCILTNNGNAPAASDDLLIVDLTGPLGIERKFTVDEQLLYSGAIGELGIGESKEYDVIVDIPADMLESYGFVTAAVRAVKPAELADDAMYVYPQYFDLSEWKSVDFDLVYPINMAASDITVEAGDAVAPTVTMELAEILGSDDVTYSIEDTSIARVDDGKILGVSSGYTTLYATHDLTGATVMAKVGVTADGVVEHEHHMTLVPAKEATGLEEGNTAYYVCDDCEEWFEDEAGTKEITDHSSVVIPVINPEESYFATSDEMCDMAIKDYAQKKDVTPASASVEKNENGSVSIVLSDEEGKVLDTYDLDPTTGVGTDSEGEEVNLPQTGNNSAKNMMVVVLAFLLIVAGGCCIAYSRSGKRRRKDDDAA